MPRATVPTDGNTPAIVAQAGATYLRIQNNGTKTLRYRVGNPVSLTDPDKEGFRLLPGGSEIIYRGGGTGTLPNQAIYAVAEDGSSGNTLTWDKHNG